LEEEPQLDNSTTAASSDPMVVFKASSSLRRICPWQLSAARRPGQMARAGTVVARDPQLPDRIEESLERSAESMLRRQRYFTVTHWMA
jgi:hypothetical protein